MSAKLYAERDPEALGEYYMRHLSAMTGEALHSKAAIAVELAWRDQQIDEICANIFRSLTPKLGGGGISKELFEQIRTRAMNMLSDEERRICGEG
jgi:hypothetical protein